MHYGIPLPSLVSLGVYVIAGCREGLCGIYLAEVLSVVAKLNWSKGHCL